MATTTTQRCRLLPEILKMKPHFAAGEVIKGFGRGSKDLGIPTANYPDEVVNNLPEDIDTGIYFGFAQIENSSVYKMVMSIGKNPYYKNEKKSMETHVMHKFDNDFYGQHMKIVILGYIRPEKNFNGVEELISAINDDIKTAEEELDKDVYQTFKSDSHFL